MKTCHGQKQLHAHTQTPEKKKKSGATSSAMLEELHIFHSLDQRHQVSDSR